MFQSALAHPSALARAPSIGLAMRPPSLSGEPPLNEMALRAPLAIKLAGANLLALVVILVFFAVNVPSVGALATSLAAVLFAAVVAHFVLAVVALRPLRGLDTVVGRVRRGDFGARVVSSPIADRDLARVGTTINTLLDELNAERTRLRQLASEIIHAGDRERATLARELHDSTAQRLAAMLYQLSAAARDIPDDKLSDRLLGIREIAGDVLEEVRTIAHTVHPAVLDDLGLGAALRYLARESSHSSGLRVAVEVSGGDPHIPAPQAAVLYRIGQTAVQNALAHAAARHIDVRLAISDRDATLDVSDDGRGFDVADAEQRRPGMGLFMMHERASLVDGRVEIRSRLGYGTTVVARVPLPATQSTAHSANII